MIDGGACKGMQIPEKEKKERKNKRKVSFKDDEMET